MLADGRDGAAGSAFDRHQAFAGEFVAPSLVALVLPVGALFQPLTIAKHQDVRPGHGATVRAGRQRRACAKVALAHGHVDRVGLPDVVAARCRALPVVDTPVAFHDAIGGKACPLEVSVDIAGEDEISAGFGRAPLVEPTKTVVRPGRPVEIEPMPVKAPGLLGIAAKPDRIGQVNEREIQPAKGRIGVPKALITPKVRQSGVDPQAGPGPNKQRRRPRESRRPREPDRIRCRPVSCV